MLLQKIVKMTTLTIIGVIFFGLLEIISGSTVFETSGMRKNVYTIRTYNDGEADNLGKGLTERASTAWELCNEHSEKLVTMDEDLFKQIKTMDKWSREGIKGLVMIKGFDKICTIYERKGQDVVKESNKYVSCWGKKRRFICQNGREQLGYWTNASQTCGGTKTLRDPGYWRDEDFWKSKLNVSEKAQLRMKNTCFLFNLSSGDSYNRSCADPSVEGALCMKEEQVLNRKWIAIGIGVGCFVVGVFSGICVLSICRCRKNEARKKRMRQEDIGAYAEISELAGYDHVTRNPLMRKDGRSNSNYDKPIHVPYTQPVDLIIDTKGDYAEPYQHIGIRTEENKGKHKNPPPRDNVRNGGRKTHMRVPEVPPPARPSMDMGGGEYADPMEACHIEIPGRSPRSMAAV